MSKKILSKRQAKKILSYSADNLPENRLISETIEKDISLIKNKLDSLDNVIDVASKNKVSTDKIVSSIESIKQDNQAILKIYENEIIKLNTTLKNLSEDYQVKLDKYNEELKKITDEYNKKLNFAYSQTREVKAQVENTLSFKLGYTLIHSFKSVGNFIALPGDLLKLVSLARQRKTGKAPLLSKTKAVSKSSKAFPKVDSRFKKQYGFKFISILDEISHTSFDSEFKLFPLNKATFETQIKGSTSLGFFIESCWKGNFGAWEYAFTSPNLQHQNAQNLLKALDTAKARHFPVIFWNKEDPMHYDKFLPISSKCDIIFTTDSNKVKDYQRDIPHAKVDTLLFAANINICNPANRFRVESENICFAGSYYGVGHDDRKKTNGCFITYYHQI